MERSEPHGVQKVFDLLYLLDEVEVFLSGVIDSKEQLIRCKQVDCENCHRARGIIGDARRISKLVEHSHQEIKHILAPFSEILKGDKQSENLEFKSTDNEGVYGILNRTMTVLGLNEVKQDEVRASINGTSSEKSKDVVALFKTDGEDVDGMYGATERSMTLLGLSEEKQKKIRLGVHDGDVFSEVCDGKGEYLSYRAFVSDQDKLEKTLGEDRSEINTLYGQMAESIQCLTGQFRDDVYEKEKKRYEKVRRREGEIISSNTSAIYSSRRKRGLFGIHESIVKCLDGDFKEINFQKEIKQQKNQQQMNIGMAAFFVLVFFVFWGFVGSSLSNAFLGVGDIIQMMIKSLQGTGVDVRSVSAWEVLGLYVLPKLPFFLVFLYGVKIFMDHFIYFLKEHARHAYEITTYSGINILAKNIHEAEMWRGFSAVRNQNARVEEYKQSEEDVLIHDEGYRTIRESMGCVCLPPGTGQIWPSKP